MSDIFEKLLKRVPLDTRLRVTNEMAMIDLLAKLGFREGYWKEEENEMLKELCKCARELTEWQLEAIKEWEKDKKSLK